MAHDMVVDTQAQHATHGSRNRIGNARGFCTTDKRVLITAYGGRSGGHFGITVSRQANLNAAFCQMNFQSDDTNSRLVVTAAKVTFFQLFWPLRVFMVSC